METSDRAASIVTSIEQGLLDGRALADVLRMCVTLSGLVGADDLRDWANKELRGYADDDEVPAYRKISAVIQIDALTGNMHVTGQTIAPYQLPEEVREHIDGTVQLRAGIAELEDQSTRRDDAKDSVKLLPAAAAYACHLIDEASGNPFQQTTSLYYNVSRSTFVGVIDQVKTVAADFVANLRQTTPTLSTAPSADAANSAIALAVTGDHASISVVSANGGSSASSSAPRIEADPETRMLTRKQLGWTIASVVVALAALGVGLLL